MPGQARSATGIRGRVAETQRHVHGQSYAASMGKAPVTLAMPHSTLIPLARSKKPMAASVSASPVSAAMRRKVEGGGIAGPAPLGYRNCRDQWGRPAVEVDEDVARLVRQAFLLVAVRNLPLRTALATVTNMGLRTKRGAPLSYSAFQAILANPFYSGRIRYKGALYTGRHEEIIPEKLFEAAREVLARHRRNGT